MGAAIGKSSPLSYKRGIMRAGVGSWMGLGSIAPMSEYFVLR